MVAKTPSVTVRVLIFMYLPVMSVPNTAVKKKLFFLHLIWNDVCLTVRVVSCLTMLYFI
jgi:hypothetical protein